MKKIINLFVYLIFIIYSVEILLFIFSSDIQKSLVNIKDKRIKIAQNNNLKFDPREPEEVFFELKKDIKDLSVPFYYSSLFSNFKAFKEAKEQNEFIPFRGPINKKTLSCAEDLNYRIINNDKFGFKNKNSVYTKEIDVILLGGSFTEGFCYTSENDIAGNLINKKINTLNLGIATTGPLVSLAVLKEFGKIYKPKHVMYLYYENNSLDVLKWEENDDHLIEYLKENRINDYVKKIQKSKNFFSKVEEESLEITKYKLKQNQKKETNVSYLRNIQDIIEINILKNRLRNFFNNRRNNYDLSLFNEIVKKMNSETKKWDGDFTFVYIPSWDRFFNKNSNLNTIINLRSEIINNIKNEKINTLDTTEFFLKSENLEDYYPLGYVGHFNEKGYKRIAEILKEKIID